MKEKEIFSNEITDKINHIKLVDEEPCKFLYNLYVKFYLSEENENIDNYLLGNNCIFQADIKQIVEQCKKNNKVIIEITNTYDERYKKIKALCENMGVTIVTIKNIKEFKSLKKLLSNNNNVFLDINTNAIQKWYNWDAILENNITSMVKRIDQINLTELKENTTEKVNEAIFSSLNDNSKEIDNAKIKLIPLIRKIDNICNIKRDRINSKYL
ncbi:MAG: hypothetical protein PHR25_03160 [Clostridia bacterium]|nr:hypothetical protein [Clostridia bacterium]